MHLDALRTSITNFDIRGLVEQNLLLYLGEVPFRTLFRYQWEMPANVVNFKVLCKQFLSNSELWSVGYFTAFLISVLCVYILKWGHKIPINSYPRINSSVNLQSQKWVTFSGNKNHLIWSIVHVFIQITLFKQYLVPGKSHLRPIVCSANLLYLWCEEFFLREANKNEKNVPA